MKHKLHKIARKLDKLPDGIHDMDAYAQFGLLHGLAEKQVDRLFFLEFDEDGKPLTYTPKQVAGILRKEALDA